MPTGRVGFSSAHKNKGRFTEGVRAPGGNAFCKRGFPPAAHAGDGS